MNRAFEAAKEKGRQAAREGRPRDANPYGDDRTQDGSVTWARAFSREWEKGWQEAQQPK